MKKLAAFITSDQQDIIVVEKIDDDEQQTGEPLFTIERRQDNDSDADHFITLSFSDLKRLYEELSRINLQAAK